MRIGWIGCAVIVAQFLAGAQAQSQDSTARKNPWFTGVSVGFPAAESDLAWLFFTFGANVTRLREGTLSPDFAIGTMPLLLTGGLVPIGMRAGVALPMQLKSGGYAVPSAGISSVSFVGPPEGIALGRNVGLALIGKGGGRVGATWHKFSGADTYVLVEFGFGGFSR